MGSSAQNSSGVHWCRCWVRFNEIPEKVPKVPEKVWEALVQSQVTFNRVPEKVPEKVPQKVPEKVGEALVRCQVRFNRVPEKVLETVWEALVQSRARSGGSGEGLAGFVGAEPGQVQRSQRRFGRLWCRARSGSTGFQRRLQRRSGRL